MKIGNTEVKFNFKALFRANALLSTQADAKDGASQLWLQFVTGDENEAVYNALRVLITDKKDHEIEDLIDSDYSDSDKFEELYKDLQSELEKSSFFRRAAKHWTDLVEKNTTSLPQKTAEERTQAKAIKDTLAEMKKSLS